ncbi:PREDICTED: 39S ribosomal protein L48, mitochondrial-like [Priapulus caudatus]|uniref:39S ribosomal protein L48, mitochondrial-like n=1 Tax=Priapulus caudatus TaxID=37621 RepID=A0ABM1EDB6_PRICU|nr:PREDICTED: 39S ribosomal protein L48, mitochondrial-like [Priapulus caudatus]
MLSRVSRVCTRKAVLHISFVKSTLEGLGCTSRSCSTTGESIFGPSFEDENAIPEYDTININIKGYDFAVLEKYARYVHNTAENIGINVTNSWPVLPQASLVQRIKQRSNLVEAEYNLSLYERVVQVDKLPSTLATILLDVIQTSLPEGIQFTMKYHTQLADISRYIPDRELKELEAQLTDLGGPSEDRKKRR